MLRLLQQAAFVLAASHLFSPALASEELTERQRIKTGKELALQWCAHCHAVSPEQPARVQADVPSFAFIASKTGQTRQKIENSLLSPHPPMPDLRLSRDAISNLSLYLLSLKEARND